LWGKLWLTAARKPVSDLDWVPQPIKLTIGPHNTVGSYRLTTIHIDVGVLDWFEEVRH
jgi:hypothetical protein